MRLLRITKAAPLPPKGTLSRLIYKAGANHGDHKQLLGRFIKLAEMKIPSRVPDTEKVLKKYDLNLNSLRISLEPSPKKIR